MRPLWVLHNKCQPVRMANEFAHTPSATIGEGVSIQLSDSEIRHIHDVIERAKLRQGVVDDQWKPTGDAQAAAEGKPVPNYQG